MPATGFAALLPAAPASDARADSSVDGTATLPAADAAAPTNAAIAIAAPGPSSGAAATTISEGGVAIAIASCSGTGMAIATATACQTTPSDQHRVAQAFIAAAIRLAPALPPPPYRGRHRRAVSACPVASGQAARP